MDTSEDHKSLKKKGSEHCLVGLDDPTPNVKVPRIAQGLRAIILPVFQFSLDCWLPKSGVFSQSGCEITWVSQSTASWLRRAGKQAGLRLFRTRVNIIGLHLIGQQWEGVHLIGQSIKGFIWFVKCFKLLEDCFNTFWVCDLLRYSPSFAICILQSWILR